MNLRKRNTSGRSTVMALLLSTATTVAYAESTVTTVAVPSGGHPSAAAVDAKGTIHLLFQTQHGPQYARSLDNGQSFGDSIAIVDQASRKPGLEFEAWDMAVEPNGRVHVALGTNAWKLKLPKEEWGFIYTQLAPDGSAFEPVRNINHKPSEGFSLAVDDTGRVTACWLADKLYANISEDHGSTFSPTVEFDPTLNPCNCCTTSITYGADGRLAVLYREETNNDRDMYLVLWDQANNRTYRTRVGRTSWKIDACPMTYYRVVPDRDGFMAVWPTEGQVYFSRMHANGEARTPVEIKTPGTTSTRTGIVALSQADGTSLVAWKKESNLGWQRYDSTGHPVGLPGAATSRGKGVAGVATKDGRFVLFQ